MDGNLQTKNCGNTTFPQGRDNDRNAIPRKDPFSEASGASVDAVALRIPTVSA